MFNDTPAQNNKSIIGCQTMYISKIKNTVFVGLYFVFTQYAMALLQ